MTTRPKPTSTQGGLNRRSTAPVEYTTEPKAQEEARHSLQLPGFNHNGHKITPGINPEGESGRRGIQPAHMFKIIWISSCNASSWVNVLWPFVPTAMALFWARPEQHLWIFITSYIAMVPSANLIGFAGQELARKLPKVFGVVFETTLGSLVEIVLFMVLLKHYGNEGVHIIQAAILGSILANLLLCLGLCFFFGGLIREEQTFHDAVSDTGSNLMLVAGMALVIPAVYAAAVKELLPDAEMLRTEVLRISRATAIILLLAFLVYVFFQTRSHHGLFDEIFEHDEQKDRDRARDMAKPKLTLSETVLCLACGITFATLMAIFLVFQIDFIVERGVKDAFVGLILIPLVEKAAEHLTAIDEAWDNQMNLALSHVLGASVQTALLNTPLVVIVGWGLNINMALDFKLFDSVVLILAILVVGGFLRDGKSNYLEGSLCFFVYVLIAVASFYWPNPAEMTAELGLSE
ncbi:hypothetical protein AAFC00_002431 [Neodothiora populina]|uniref:Vacuolar calcium ion transporter n=1 Tax=Neodothiora populina TaxID=2781224 RepID=A0ABR3P763_9PEZI